MKKYYTLLACASLVLSAHAQPTINQSNSSPTIGDNYVYSRCNWDNNPGASGANQTWDFSGLTEITQTNIDYVDPSTCPSPSSFPTANLGVNYDSGSQYEYYENNSSGQNRVGFYGGGVSIPYQNPETIIQYPFTYLDSYVDPFASTFTNGGTWDRAGDVTVTADGYGTLILPNATITNVLRVKVSEDYGDSFGGSEIYHYNSDIYAFYKPGVGIPVLALTHFMQGSTSVDYGNFLDLASLNLPSEDKLSIISIYPNPATDLIHFNWNGTTQVDRIEVYDLTGKLTAAYSGLPESIDVSTFESGYYTLMIWDGDNREMRKFVKQ